MKKNLVTWVVVIATTLVSVAAYGQQGGFGGGRGRMNLQAPGIGGFDKLKLTDDQKAKIQKLQKEFRTQDSIASAKFQTEQKALVEKRMKSFEGLLTPEQMTEWKKFSDKRDSLAKSNGRENRGFGSQGMGQRGMNGQRPGMGQRGMNGQESGFGQRGMNEQRPGLNQQREMNTQRPGIGQNKQPQGFAGRQQTGQQTKGLRGNQRGGLQPQGFTGGQNAGRPQTSGTMKAPFGSQNGGFGMQARGGKPELVNPEERIDKQVEAMTQKLDLTPDQSKKIKDIKMKYAKKELDTYKKLQKKIDAREKKVNAPTNEIKSVLNEEQLKKLEAHRIEAPYSTEELSLDVVNFASGESLAQMEQAFDGI
jgi:hypothetical protein